MDPALIQTLAQELGLTLARLNEVRSSPSRQEAERRLEALKADAKKTYRQLALKYHPDRNPDDPNAGVRFGALSTALAEIQKLKLGAPRPPPVQVWQTVRWVHVGPMTPPTTARVTGFGAVIDTTNGGTATGTAYDARRVVFIRGGIL